MTWQSGGTPSNYITLVQIKLNPRLATILGKVIIETKTVISAGLGGKWLQYLKIRVYH